MLRKLLPVIGIAALAACSDPIGPDADLGLEGQQDASIEQQDDLSPTETKQNRPMDKGGVSEDDL